MKKTLVLSLLILCLAVVGTAAVYWFYVLPRHNAAAQPVEPVVVPQVFARYAEDIHRADQIIRNQPELFRDAAPLTADRLHGFFDLPLKQAVRLSQLRAPGDPRAYRKGVHQGIDFYETRRGDPIYAAAPGVVIRIDTDYQPVDKRFRDEILAKCASTWNGTPGSVELPAVEEPYGDVLDTLRGRQVIVYHGRNARNEPVMSLYAHLLDVNQELAAHDVVGNETRLGTIGNSGTSGEMENNPNKENHLHIELFVGGLYWTPKQPDEIGVKQGAARYGQLQQMILDELSSPYAPPQETAPAS